VEEIANLGGERRRTDVSVRMRSPAPPRALLRDEGGTKRAEKLGPRPDVAEVVSVCERSGS